MLESAFAAQDDRLVALLTEYRPAQEMGFDRDELKQLLIIRGRASHGTSRRGLDEILAVGRECGKQVNRLKSLVERVILTKKTWGAPTTEVEELTPAIGWVGRDNSITIFTRIGGTGGVEMGEPAPRALRVSSNTRSSNAGGAMNRRERHIVPNPEGGWDVRAPGSDRASSHHAKQSEAIDRAKEILGNSGGGEAVIHDRHGKIRDSDTVPPGRDPFPPRDMRH